MAMTDLGTTTHFTVRYDSAVAGALARAQAVLDTCERDLARLAFYLPYMSGGGGDPYLNTHRIAVQVLDLTNNRGGADNSSTGGPGNRFHTIRIGAIHGSGGQVTDDYARFLFVAELAEVLMPAYGWVPNDSRGEALSRIMAEEFYPSLAYSEGSAPWVNAWMGTNPRDFTSLGEPDKSDTNALSFGVGILYLNYLRSQLGYSLSAILGTGGSQLIDAYRALTGQPAADGISGFRALLERFYPAGRPVTLLSNNPFPLDDATARSVGLAVRQSLVPHRKDLVEDDIGLSLGGTVHVRPFVTCPERDYRYVLDRQRRQLDVVVSTVGLARPRFSWTVNGVKLVGSSGSATVTAEARFDVPEDPRNPKVGTQSFTFTWSAADEFSWQGLNHRLVLRNVTRDGHVRLDLAVAVNDAALDGDPDTTASTSTLLDASSVVYEQAYYDDGARCAGRLRDAVESHHRGLALAIDLVRTLPDPPPPWVAGALVEALAEIRAEVESGRADQESAVATVQLLAAQLGSSASAMGRLLGVEAPQEGSGTSAG